MIIILEILIIKLFKSSKYLAVAAVEWQDTDEDQVRVSQFKMKYRKYYINRIKNLKNRYFCAMPSIFQYVT